MRLHGTTQEIPRVRFERDERAELLPLAPRPYHSLVLAPERLTRSSPVVLAAGARPHVPLERRPLAVYAHLAEVDR